MLSTLLSIQMSVLWLSGITTYSSDMGELTTSKSIETCPETTTRVYLSTSLYWKEFNRLEAERFSYLEQRRGVHLPYDRWIEYSEEYANRNSDGIICLGNQFARDSYRDFPLVVNLNNRKLSR